MARRKPGQQLQYANCDGVDPATMEMCRNYVAIRRPSEDNLHFCQNPACQAKKQQVYRQRQARKIIAAEREEMRHEMVIARRFVHAATWLPRVQCQECGLENAISGYAHRSGVGSSQPCFGTGDGGGGGGDWLDLFHPELKQEVQEDSDG